MTRRVIALIALSTSLFGIGIALGGPAHAAGTSDASKFVAYTNDSRGSAGLAGYANAEDLAQVALGQAQRMAARHAIYHNPNLGGEVANWQAAGENVGVGASAESLHSAFMNSPSHRANILSSDYTQIGVGTVFGDDGRLYVAEVFRLPADGQAEAPAPAPAPEPEPAPAPEPVAAPASAPAPAPAPEPVTVPVAPPAPAPAAPQTTTPAAATAAAQSVAAKEHAPAFTAQTVSSVTPSASDFTVIAWVAAVAVLGVLTAHAVVISGRVRARRVSFRSAA